MLKTAWPRQRERSQSDAALQYENLEPRRLLASDSGEVVFSADFEDAAVQRGQFLLVESVSGFRATGPAGTVEVQDRVPFVGNPSQGDQLLELDFTSGVAVDLSDRVNEGLTLRFDYSPRPRINAEQNSIEIWWNGELLNTVSRDGRGNSRTSFETVEYSLPAVASGTATLEFRSNSPNDQLGRGGLLDDICVFAATDDSVEETNQLPNLSAIADQTLEVGQSLDVTATLESSTEDPVTYSILNGPDDLTINANTGELFWIASRTNVDSSNLNNTTIEIGDEQQVFQAGFEDVSLASDSHAAFGEVSGFTSEHPFGIEVQREISRIGTSPEGNQHLELDNRAAAFRDVATSPADQYRLSLQYSPRPGVGEAEASVQVWWDGELVDTMALDGSSYETSRFREYSFALPRPTTNNTRLVLRSNAPRNSPGEGGLFDDVVLSRLPVTATNGVENLFNVVVQATNGNERVTEDFAITIVDVVQNQAPVLAPISDRSLVVGSALEIETSATDADLPDDVLEFELLGELPSGVQIDSDTGELTWDTSEILTGDYEITVVVTDRQGASDSQTFTIEIVDCRFDDLLTGWAVAENGGSVAGHGTVLGQDCIATLTEGDSFETTLSTTFVVPENASELSFTYDTLNFDTTDPSFINDAFEVALIDSEGRSLVTPYADGRDAFFNITEELAVATSPLATVDGNTVTLDTSGILVGETATLIFRLANNDDDVTTSVQIVDFSIPGFGTGPTVGSAKFYVADPAIDGVFAYDTEGQRQTSFQATARNLQTSGITSNADGSRLWSIDRDSGIVSVYGGNGIRVGTWFASDVNEAQGIATDGTDIWIVDAGSRQVQFYDEAISTGIGSKPDDAPLPARTASSSFTLDVANTSPSGLTTDGNLLWVTDDIANAVFVYALDGTLQGSWQLDAANNDPSGITNDANGGNDLWVVDRNGTVFRYENSTTVTSGALTAASTFTLDDRNGSPEGIADPTPIQLVALSTPFNNPIGIDYHAPTDSIVVSVNYSNGQPHNFELIDEDGNASQFSTASGLGDEVKIATVKDGNTGGFSVGDLFVGNGIDGQISQLSADGNDLVSVWADLPGSNNGLFRGGIFVDDTGVFDGDLIAVTNAGEVWRVASDGQPTFITDTNVHLEGVYVVPLDERYGPLSGKIVAGAEQQGLLYAISEEGAVETYDVGVEIEDIDIVLPGQNFFGVNFGTGQILGASSEDFTPYANGILLTQETHNGSGLFHLLWNGTDLVAEEIQIAANSATVGQWEHVTFATAGLAEIDASLPAPLINASIPRDKVLAGDTLLAAGAATAFGTLSGGSANSIELVTVNALPVEVLDNNGRFFSQLEILPGLNQFVFEATDLAGQRISTTLEIFGTSSDAANDLSQFVDVTASFSGVYGRTSFDQRSEMLFVDLATRNDGTFATDVPLYVGVKNISDPLVELMDSDGVTEAGVPYYDFSSFVTNGRLEPSEITGSPSIRFHNPRRAQFDYELEFYTTLNEAPEITSLPDIEALAGRLYEYDVDAIDRDDDTLTYSLLLAPQGMTIDASTGVILWEPETIDIGNYDITIQVDDGRGGRAEQRFTLSVIEPPPNRPPEITSDPVRVAQLSQIADTGEIPIDLTTWTPVTFQVSDSEDFESIWEVSDEGTFVEQQLNSDPSYFLSDFQVTEELISGGFRVVDSGSNGFVDNDFIGFVFAHQNTNQFYLFDWKAGSQTVDGAVGLRGMSVKVIDVAAPYSNLDYWNTDGNGDRAQTLYHNDIGWENFTDYRFELEFRPGDFAIRVFEVSDSGDDSILLDEIRLTDSTYISGGFGFYNYSQGQVQYNGFTRQAIAERPYIYDVEATDPDGDDLTYSIVQAPTGMTIDDQTGLILWSPEVSQIGNHDVTVRVEDGRGGVAEQSFIVAVKGDPDNNAPVIVSTPVTVAITGDLTNDNVVLIDDTTNGYYNESIGLLLDGTSAGPTSQSLDLPEPDLTPAGEILGDWLDSSAELNPNWSGLTPIPRQWAVNNETAIVYEFGSDEHRLEDANLTLNIDNGAFVWLDGRYLAGYNSLSEFEVPVGRLGSGKHFLQILRHDFGIVNGFSIELTANQIAVSGDGYAYDVNALDADDDVLSYSLPNAPEGMTIDKDTGLITWTDTQPTNLEHTLGDKDFFGFGTGTIGDDVPSIEFDNRTPEDPEFTDVDARTGKTLRSEGLNNFEWTHDLSELALPAAHDPRFEFMLDLAIGGIQDGLPNAVDDRLFVEGIEVEQAFDDVDQGDTGTSLLSFELTESQIRSVLIDGKLDVFLEGGSLSATAHNDSYFIDYATVRMTSADAAAVKVRVEDGRRGFDEQSFVITVGQGTGLVRGVKFDDINANGIRDTDFIVGDMPDVVFVLDRSGSMDDLFTGTPVGDVNNDGLSDTLFDAAIAGYVALNNNLIVRGFGDTAEVGIVTFSGNATQVDVNPVEDGVQLFTSPNADFNNNGIRDIEEALIATRTIFQGTNFEAPLQTALLALNSHGTAAGSGNVIFISDGVPNRGGSIDDEVSELVTKETNLQAFGVGPGASLESLAIIDGNTQVFSTSDELIDAFGGLNSSSVEFVEPGIAGWTIYLDQNQNGVRDVGERFTVTDENGGYEFINLPPDTYFVREELQSGWQQTAPGQAAQTEFLGPLPYLGVSDSPFDSTNFNEFEFEDFEDGEFNIPGVSYGFARGDGDENSFSIATSGPFLDSVDEDDGSIDGSGIAGGSLFPAGNRVGGSALGIEFNFDKDTLGYLPTHAGIVWTEGSPNDTIVFEAIDALGAVILSERSDGIGDSSFAGTTAEDRFFGAVHAAGIAAIRVYGERQNANSFEVDHFQFGVQDLDGRHRVLLAEGELVEDRDFGNVQLDTLRNSAPVFETTPPVEAIVGELLRYDATATDLENDALTYSIVNGPDGLTINPSNGTVVWLPTAEALGQHDVLLEVKDERGRSSLQSFTLEVVPFNTAPVVNSTPPTQAVANLPLSYQILAQDAQDNVLTFTKTSGPAELTVDPATGLVSWTPVDADIDIAHAVSILIADDRGGETNHDLTLPVAATAPNVAPEISSTPVATARLGRGYNYTVLASDTNADPLTYTLVSGPDGMMFEQNRLTWTPTAAQVANAQAVELLISDGRGGEATQTFDVRVLSQDINSAPEIVSSPSQVARQDRLYGYDLIAEDADGDTVLWSLLESPIGMTLDPIEGTLRWTPTIHQVGSNPIVIQATDALGATATQSFEIEVTCVNGSPMIRSTPLTAGVAGSTYFYAVRATDPDGDQPTFRFGNQDSIPDGLTIDGNGLVRWNPTNEQIGSHDVVIVAEDSEGAFALQQYTIVVEAATDDQGNPNSNRAPVISSTPKFSAEVDGAYSYAVVASDPEGETLTFELANADSVPTGLTIDSSTGEITWTPTADQIGDHVVAVLVKDLGGAAASQAFTISVRENMPPEIQSSPPTSIAAGALYRYSVRATDPESGALTYELTAAPEDMSIDRFGRIIWQTAASQMEPIDVSVTVTDDRGKSDSQSWQITPVADTVAPEVSVTVRLGSSGFQNSGNIDLGSQTLVRVIATDQVGVESMQLEMNGTLVSLNDLGQFTFDATTLGPVTLRGIATDAAGNVGEKTITIHVVDPSQPNRPLTPGEVVPTDPTLPPHPGFEPTDNQGPTVKITSPAPATTVSNLVPILGTVDDPEDNLWYYHVYYARADKVSFTNLDIDDPDWVLLKESTQEVIDGELAVFDSSAVTNDPYVIAVAAFDVNGRGFIQQTLVTVEGNVLVGNFRLEFTDLSIPLAGIPIEVSRVYDTLNADDESDFGFGWMLGMQDARILEVGALGQGGVAENQNDKFVPDVTKVYLTDPNGQRVGFTYQEEYQSGCSPFFGCLFGMINTPLFEADPGVYSTLTIDETQVSRGGVLGAFSEGINPTFYTLTTKDGLAYRYHDTDGLLSITDLNGNEVTFTDDGIQHSSGQSIDYVRDHRDRITSIIDPAGNAISYEYDLAGDLVKFTNQEDLDVRYTYRTDPGHYLDEAYDSLGRRSIKVEYDEEDMFVGVLDADGNRLDERDFDTDNNTGIVRDANGNATTLVYDDRGNVLTETDPLGNVTEREYNDPANPDLETRIVDRVGNVTERKYDARGNLMNIMELGGRENQLTTPTETSFTYDTGNRVRSITNADNRTTMFDYDGSGNLTKIVNADGDISRFAYDGQGRRTSFTDFNGNTTTFDYLTNDQPAKVTFADSSYQRFEYNQFGQVTFEGSYEADDTLVEVNRTTYDRSGRSVEEITGEGADQTIVRRVYDGQLLDWEAIVDPQSLDGNGNLTESPSTPIGVRNSRITDFEYDSRDRLIAQTDAEGGVVHFRYDMQDNRVALMDPVGNVTSWVYDELNRIVEERDPLYWEEVKSRDAAFTGLDDLDFLNLIAPVTEGDVADPLYDDPITADIANNVGADHVSLTAYDAEGRAAKDIDRNGRRVEYEYDFAGRLLTEQWFAAKSDTLVNQLEFTYDELGNQLTAVDLKVSDQDDSESFLTFTYDALNRLETVDNAGTPDAPNVILTYTYDAQGNVASVADNFGVTVRSEYDARNRLEIREWFDADGSGDVDDARVEFDYNATGRISEMRRFADRDGDTANLIGRTVRTYDLAGRSGDLQHLDASDANISSYDYGYDFAGLLNSEGRTHQLSQFSQDIVYGYDLTGQLLDANYSGQENETFSYDANGNRESSTTNGTEYSTETGNRLASDGTFEYQYDGEGNLVKKIRLVDGDGSEAGEVTDYEYDHRNRLVQVTIRASEGSTILLEEVGYQYDALGRRIARTENGETIHFVYNGDVWADFDEAGVAVARYLFGDTIDQNIARFQPGEGTVWYLGDRLGTIRDLIGASGQLANHTEFDAYGQILSQLSEVIADRFAFTGREFDQLTGLNYYRSRYYLQSTGRFLSQDRTGFSAGDANLYRYVNNAPNGFVDPSGEIAIVGYLVQKSRSIGVAVSTSRLGLAIVGALNWGSANLSKFGGRGVTRWISNIRGPATTFFGRFNNVVSSKKFFGQRLPTVKTSLPSGGEGTGYAAARDFANRFFGNGVGVRAPASTTDGRFLGILRTDSKQNWVVQITDKVQNFHEVISFGK